MADTFKFSGGWSSAAGSSGLSGSPQVDASIQYSLALERKLEVEYDLQADAPQAVGFGGLSAANVVIIVADAKVRVRLTSADGSSQSVPVDGQLVLISESVPVTALDLTRVAGQSTIVKVFLGQAV